MTAYLIDSHVYVWLQTSPERLRRTIIAALADPANRIFFSVASAVELFDKFSKGRNTGLNHMLGAGPDALLADLAEARLTLLPITMHHAAAVSALPVHHRDPFDRLLIAQALSEGATLVSGDRAFEKYAGLSLLKA